MKDLMLKHDFSGSFREPPKWKGWFFAFTFVLAGIAAMTVDTTSYKR